MKLIVSKKIHVKKEGSEMAYYGQVTGKKTNPVATC
jgi:hypothetical protein